MDVDHGADLASVDGCEHATYFPVGTSITQKIDACVVTKISVREAAASGGTYTTLDRKALVAAAEVVDNPPEVGGLLETHDGDELWYVVGVELLAQRKVFRMFLRVALLHTQLKERVSIEEVEWGVDDDLSPTETWTAHASNVAAAFQTVDSALVVESERRSVKVTHRVYVAGPETIQAGMRVVDGNGDKFKVLRVTNKGGLGTLIILDAVKDHDPQDD